MSKYGRTYGGSFTALAFVVVVIGLIVGITISLNNRPTSSANVIEISDGIIRLPSDGTLIMTKSSGKSSTLWTIDYDGNGTLTLDRDGLFGGDHMVEHLEPGVDTEIDFGWGTTSLHATADKEGFAYVTYPNGFLSSWNFRSHSG